MKTTVCILVLLTCMACGATFAFAMLPSTEIYASLSFGSLFEGFQKDMPEQLISPPPDGYSVRLTTVGVRQFFADVLGIEGSFGFFGSTSATWSQVSKPLEIYGFDVITLGLILRLPIALDYNSHLSIFAGGGATYALMSLSNDFTYPFEAMGLHFDDVKPDFGWYGKLGIGYYLARHFFLDVAAHYSFLNAKLDPSGKQLGGTYLFVAVTFGVAF